MSTARQIRQYPYDNDLVAKAAGLVAVSAGHTIITVGDAVFAGVLVIDVTAIEIASNDERFLIHVQGSDSPTFASGVQNLATLELAALGVRTGDAGVSLVGRYELQFVNEQAGLTYSYIRAYTVATGTIATGVNYSAFFSRRVLGAG